MDFIVYTLEVKNLIKEVKTVSEARIGTEHRLVKTDLKMELIVDVSITRKLKSMKWETQTWENSIKKKLIFKRVIEENSDRSL